MGHSAGRDTNAQQDEIYTVSAAALLYGTKRHVLPNAVPLPPGSSETDTPTSSYGWVSGVHPTPSKEDRYVVEFVGKREFRILAYVDRFGRAFSTSHPLAVPPARKPDLSFVRIVDGGAAHKEVPSQGAHAHTEHGFVEVHAEDEGTRKVAQYVCKRGRYTFSDTWYDFGSHVSHLSYDDAVARAYLAFVYRPHLGGAETLEQGTSFVHDRLKQTPFLPALRDIVDAVHRAEDDPVVQVPALVQSLVQWLEEAGLDNLHSPAVPDDALRLVRTERYANLYYLAQDGEESAIDCHTIWALEAALNRFTLLEETLGDRAVLANDADCARWDAYLIETAGAQTLNMERLAETPRGTDDGEWEVRCRLAGVLERLKLPVRIEVKTQVNVVEGLAAFQLIVPDAALMPARRWADGQAGGSWENVPAAERDAQARRYAMHFGVALAAAAFEISPSINRVDVTACPLGSDGASAASKGDIDAFTPSGEFPAESQEEACYQVTLTRQAYEETSHFRSSLEGDPALLFDHCGAVYDLPGADPFVLMKALPSTIQRHELPELGDALLPPIAQTILGVENAHDLRISTEFRRRRVGEKLADRIADATNATEAMRIVREQEQVARALGDDQEISACTRLMEALAQGTLDTEDQNAVVTCFVGEDRCATALARAKALASHDPAEAVTVLIDAVAEAAALDGYIDGTTTVYRAFESYAARVCYARALQAELQKSPSGSQPEATPVDDTAVPTLAARVAADANKRIQLVPDSFFFCHLEIVALLERSFEHVDDAIRYGKRAVEIAPTSTAGYRELGRAYMLVGDMETAAAVFQAGLEVASHPNDAAGFYYQLAYVLWKAGRPRAGAACYLKSMMVSPVLSLQAMSELKELVAEHNIDPIERNAVDDELRSAGILLAPTEEVFEILDTGAVAAVDAGLFPVAHSLLSLCLCYRQDDALVNVLRSLE